MKAAHAQARLLHNLKRHIGRCVLGSEPFAAGLKAVEETAWSLFELRDIDWPSLQVFGGEEYAYRVNTYMAVVGGGIEKAYSTPIAAPKKLIPTPNQREVLSRADKAIRQFERHAEWISRQFARALDESADGTEYTHSRRYLRCITAQSAFLKRMEERYEQLKAWRAGSDKAADNRIAAFIRRHGQVHFYLDGLYPTREAAEAAVQGDSEAIPPDHDLIVLMWEEAIPDRGEPSEENLEELERYLRSVDHKYALEEAERYGCDPAVLSRKERTVRQLVKAARAITLMRSDKLPIEGMHKLLGFSQTYRKNLFKAERAKISKAGYITKEELLRVLKNRLEKMRPSRKQRRKREREVERFVMQEQAAKISAVSPEELAEEEKAANPKWPCQPDCQCIRHQS